MRMRPLRSMLIFILVVFLGGGLLAPWLHWLVKSFAPASDLPFHRFVDRSLLGLALLGLWPFLRSLGATSWREVGLVAPGSEWRRLARGFALGFGSLAVVAAIALAGRARAFDDSLDGGQIALKLLGAALTAVVVAVLEELLFRGAIFGALRRVWDWRMALLLSSMIYAILHFFAKAELTGPVTWSSGLELLPEMLRGFGDWRVVIPGFFNLTLAGWLLGLAYQRTGTLYFSIGLHGGWIFWLKAYGAITRAVPEAATWFYGTQKLTDGWLALAVLAAALVVLARFLPSKSGEAPA